MSPWDGHMTYQIYPNIATWHVSVTPLLDVAASLRLPILRVFLDAFELDKILHCHQSGVLPTCKHQDIPFRLVTSMRATCSAAKSWTICRNSSWRRWTDLKGGCPWFKYLSGRPYLRKSRGTLLMSPKRGCLMFSLDCHVLLNHNLLEEGV